MKYQFLTGALITAFSLGALASASYAQSDAARAECDRLISMLEQRPPAEAHDALQKMRVFREGNQYQACINMAQADQSTSVAQNSLQADQIAGMDVFNEKGVQVGDVDRLARADDRQTYVFVTYRGPRWPGNKQVALPLDKMAFRDGHLVVSGMGEDELHNMPSVHQDGRTYTALGGTEVVSVPRLDASPTETGSVRPQQ